MGVFANGFAARRPVLTLGAGCGRLRHGACYGTGGRARPAPAQGRSVFRACRRTEKVRTVAKKRELDKAGNGSDGQCQSVSVRVSQCQSAAVTVGPSHESLSQRRLRSASIIAACPVSVTWASQRHVG
eukprot:1874075-Rhodomonas_salina.3